ncbi:MAG: hypothetical protein KUG77_25460 [Nannocystaceae bacterium]|nr:hypothetical protein [Nannocystaceae bacterium]
MRRTVISLSTLLLFACGDDVSSAGSGDETGSGTSAASPSETPATTSGTASGSGSTGGPEQTTSAADDSTSTGADAQPPPEFAHDIRLERLTVNQATQVEVVVGGLEVEPEDYNTRVISGRRTLVRGFWSLHANFAPRDIMGRLTVGYPDGTTLEQDFVQFVDAESSDGAGASSFQWLLEPEDVTPGMTYRVRLFEMPDSEASGELSDPPPIAPLAGPGTLGLYDVPLQLRVVLVPVQHEFEGCTSMPDITQEDVDAMRMALEQNNPVQQATFEVREPMVYTETIGDSGSAFSPVLAALARARAADNPDPSVYYYGLLDPCDGFPPGLGGQAIAIAGPPTMGNGQERISTGRWNNSGAAAASTFVHEVGHTQGRRHVRCSGGEAGIDAAYPHAGGRIGVWGFGIYDFELYSPTGGRDYMTYCSNEWVSDYSWEQTLEVIEVLTGFDLDETPPENGEDVVLAGMVHEDGRTEWWTQPGRVDASTALGTARFETPTGPVQTIARIRPLPHGHNARYVEVPLTAASRAMTTVEVSAPGSSFRVGADEIRTIR